MKGTMPTQLTEYRRKLKEKNPEKYAEYLQKQRDAARERRRKKKEKWENEPHTRAMEDEREKELAAQRNRNRQYYQKKKSSSKGRRHNISSTEPLSSTPKKKPKDMTTEEFRLHNNRLRAESRARQSAQKKRRVREKDRAYKKKQRDLLKDRVLSSAPSFINSELSLPAHPSPQPLQDHQTPPALPLSLPVPVMPCPVSPRPLQDHLIQPSSPSSPSMPHSSTPVPPSSPPPVLPSTSTPDVAFSPPTPILPSTSTPVLPSTSTPVLPSTSTPDLAFSPPTPILPSTSTPVLPSTSTPVLPSTSTPVLPSTSTPVPPSSSMAPVTDHAPPSGQTSLVSRRLPKTLYNLTSKFKRSLSKKTDSETYARVVKNLATPRTPEKRKAIKEMGLLRSPIKETHKVRRDRVKSQVRKESEVLYDKIQDFYKRMDISRQLPHQRYATKAGAAYVMNITIKGAYRQYMEENPGCSIGYTKFSLLRPKNVKRLGSVPAETCLCIYCLNIRYKVDAINRLLARKGLGQPLPDETRLLDVICCKKEPGKRWHKPECILGDCQDCKDSLQNIKKICEPVANETVTWTQWGRSDTRAFKLDVYSRKGSTADLLDEMERNIDHPTKQTSFRQHLMTAFWQFDQYRRLKFSLEEDEALLVMDFAENRKAMFNAEVKSAHFSKEMVTLHPIISFYKNPRGQLVRHSLMYLSDDLVHDYHLVNHFTVSALDFLKKQVHLRRVIIFSDGCAAQYKGKGTFADLSLLSGLNVQRAYFGSEHGKGEADGETGVFSQQQTRAVLGGLNLRNAQDNFEWAQRTLTKTGLSARTFFLVKKEDVTHERPQTDVKTIPGTRSYHQVQRIDDYIIKCRRLACFCSGCRMDMEECCVNKKYVGTSTVHKLKESAPRPLDNAFLGEKETDTDKNEQQPQETHNTPPSAGSANSINGALEHNLGLQEMAGPEVCQLSSSSSSSPPSSSSDNPSISAAPTSTAFSSSSSISSEAAQQTQTPLQVQGIISDIHQPPSTSSQPEISTASSNDNPPPPSSIPAIGDYLKVILRVGKSTQEHICLVTEPEFAVPLLLEDDFVVTYLKKSGKFFVLPPKERTFTLNVKDSNVVSVEILAPPHIDSRGRHYF